MCAVEAINLLFHVKKFYALQSLLSSKHNAAMRQIKQAPLAFGRTLI